MIFSEVLLFFDLSFITINIMTPNDIIVEKTHKNINFRSVLLKITDYDRKKFLIDQ